MKGALAGTRASGWVRARVRIAGGASCDSGTARWTARRDAVGRKPATGRTVKRVFATGIARLRAAMAKIAQTPESAEGFGRVGAGIVSAARNARTALKATRPRTASQRRARTLALSGFLRYERGGRDLVFAAKNYMPTDDPRGDALVDRGLKRMALGARDLSAAGRLLGSASRASPSPGSPPTRTACAG